MHWAVSHQIVEESQEQRNTRLAGSDEQRLVFHLPHHFVRIVQSDDIRLQDLTGRLHAPCLVQTLWTESTSNPGSNSLSDPYQKNFCEMSDCISLCAKLREVREEFGCMRLGFPEKELTRHKVG